MVRKHRGIISVCSKKTNDFSIINLQYHKKKKNILINELVTFRASKDLLYNYVFEQNEENIPIHTNI